MGENREQELKVKAPGLPGPVLALRRATAVEQGPLGRPARPVVHSVDRSVAGAALSQAAVEEGRVLRCLLQVSLATYGPDGAATGMSRGGVQPDDVPALAAEVAAADGLELGGVMAVAPLGSDPDEAFAGLAEVASRLRSEHPAPTGSRPG